MGRHVYVVAAYTATLPKVTLYLALSYPAMRDNYYVKITVHILAAGCQLSYRKFYG